MCLSDLLKYFKALSEKLGMKNTILFISLLLSISAFSMTPEEKGTVEVIKQINDVSMDVKNTGTIKPNCESCLVDHSKDLIVELNKNEILLKDLNYDGKIPFWMHEREDKLIVLTFKRNAKTPKEVTFRWMNTAQGGATNYIVGYTSQYGGTWYSGCPGGCMYEQLKSETDFDLDFSKAPELKDGEEQVIQVTLQKADTDKFDYKVIKVEVVSGPLMTGKATSKWIVDGHNFKFK